MTELFYAYAAADSRYRDDLEKQLGALKKQGTISSWQSRVVGAGSRWQGEVSPQVEAAKVVLLLVSDDFVGTDYAYGKEVQRALERHRSGDARLIPILLRPCNWKATPFASLTALPRNGKAVTRWSSSEAAFKEIAAGIAAAAAGPAAAPTTAPAGAQPRPLTQPTAAEPPLAAVVLQPEEIGSEYRAAPSSADAKPTESGAQFVSVAEADGHRVAQLVYRAESNQAALSRMAAGIRAESSKGGVDVPLPAGVDVGRAVRRGGTNGHTVSNVSVFAAKGQFLVAAKVIGSSAGHSSSADPLALAGDVVKRMLARIPG